MLASIQAATSFILLVLNVLLHVYCFCSCLDARAMYSLLEMRGASVAVGTFQLCKVSAVEACSLSLSAAGNSGPNLSSWYFGRLPPVSIWSRTTLQLEGRKRLDLFTYSVSRKLGLMSSSVSVVEIEPAPLSLAADSELGLALESSNTKSTFQLAAEERSGAVTDANSSLLMILCVKDIKGNQPPEEEFHKKREPGKGHGQTKLGRPTTGELEVDGFSIEGVSVGGQETCVMLPALKVAFDIGRCPARSIDQHFLFITHPHMDHIGGLTMYVASRGLLKRKVPTVIVPKCVKATVEKLFAVQRELDDSPLPVNLIGMDVGEEFDLGKGLIVKAFKTYHVVPSQGYVIYTIKQKLKAEYQGLPGIKLKDLKASGVEVTETIRIPEVAFTGDTTSSFFLDEANSEVLKARLLIMESTFLDDSTSVENANEYGHTHLYEILAHAEKFKNKNIVLIHFSARYAQEDIFKAIEKIPPPLQGRVLALTEGF